MDISEFIKDYNYNTLTIVSESTIEHEIVSEDGEITSKSDVHIVNVKNYDELAEFDSNSRGAIILKKNLGNNPANLFSLLLDKLTLGGSLVIDLSIIKDISQIELDLKTNGYTDIKVTKTYLIAHKPKYEVGSSVKLNLTKKPQAVWKLDDDAEDDEIIDPDDLLDDDDLKKPDPSSLKVCGTTGKRKACKDCSCGLADELAEEAQKGKVIDTGNAPKSSCGSCYLGDAFRCASCPYLGMPAFKPGEKIQLSADQLKSDF